MDNTFYLQITRQRYTKTRLPNFLILCEVYSNTTIYIIKHLISSLSKIQWRIELPLYSRPKHTNHWGMEGVDFQAFSLFSVESFFDALILEANSNAQSRHRRGFESGSSERTRGNSRWQRGSFRRRCRRDPTMATSPSLKKKRL